jgi:hypothetical protein
MHVVTTLIGMLIAAIRELLGQLLAFLSSFDKNSPAQPTVTIPVYDPSAAEQPEQTANELSDLIGRIVSIISIVGISILVGLMLLKFALDFLHLMSRRRRATANFSVEKISDGWSFEWRSLLGMLLRGLGKVPRWLFRKWKPAPIINDDPPLVRAVRNTYRELLHWSAKHELGRAAQETPYEFLKRVSVTFPDAEPDLRILTEHYVLARYYPQRLTEEDCQAANESWHRLQKQLRRGRMKNSSGEEMVADTDEMMST